MLMSIVIVEDSGNYQSEEPDWVVINKKTGEKDFVTAWSETAALYRSKFSHLSKDEVEIQSDEGEADDEEDTNDGYEVLDYDDYPLADDMIFDEPDEGEFTEEQERELETLRKRLIGDIRGPYIEALNDIFDQKRTFMPAIRNRMVDAMERASRLVDIAYKSDHEKYRHLSDAWGLVYGLFNEALDKTDFVDKIDSMEHVADILESDCK